MSTVMADMSVDRRSNILLPALVGGCAAAALDAASAFYTFGWRMPKGIAAGLLGASARQGGAGTWTLGLSLHFAILIVAAVLYGIASWRWTFMRVNFLLCGVYYGISVFLFMNLVVVPLSAFPLSFAPFPVSGLIEGMLMHVLLVGLPISLSYRVLGREGADLVSA
ncbi:MAG TPA: hypothetical protein VIC29_16240 [Steroidobacteraceae bacterium]|jgi:hypothetical protein